MKEIFEVAGFLDFVRMKMRYGASSREPVQLLHVEWKGDWLKCDWLMRPVDSWDEILPERLRQISRTLQALRDAIHLRKLVFEAFPTVESAELRMFRATDDHRLDLVLTGAVTRDNDVLERIPSLAMRAKMCGFQFTMSEGTFESMERA
jgi:hypothetical protein